MEDLQPDQQLEDDKTFYETAKKMIFIIITIYLIAVIVSVVINQFGMTFLKGLTLGSVFSILKVLLLCRTLKKVTLIGEANAVNYARLHYALRYFLTALLLALSILEPSISFLGTCIGLVSLQVSAYTVNIFLKK